MGWAMHVEQVRRTLPRSNGFMVICPLMLVPEINFSRWDHDWDQAIRQAHACHCSFVMAWMPLS